MSKCNFSYPKDASNPIHQRDDGTWWFWDEFWSEELGPYKTKKEADNACYEYAEELEKQHRERYGGGEN